MLKIIFIALAIFCFQHLIRDYLQDRGVKNWYTTFGHLDFVKDTPLNNHIGMLFFVALGGIFLYLAFRTT
jgi:hypothetical protein